MIVVITKICHSHFSLEISTSELQSVTMNLPVKKAAVLGYPINHSRSPMIHQFWLRKYGLEGSYEKFEVAPGKLVETLELKRSAGYQGFNVTLPHKPAAFALAEVKTPTAEAIGAVNTLWWDEAGRLHGDNSDVYGFLANLDAGKADWAGRKQKAVVLGAGGAALGIVYALRSRGFQHIVVSNRTLASAEDLAARWPEFVHARSWESRSEILEGADLLVNTTSLGLAGGAGLDIDLAALPAHATVTDIVYVPLETDLLRRARLRGLAAVDGLGMLLHQARPGFHHWFGVQPEVDAELRALVEADLGALQS